MEDTYELLEKIFTELNKRIEKLNHARRRDGGLEAPKAKVRLLGQLSLLANEKISAELALARTGDLDALLTMDHMVKTALQKILIEHGLVYDEDSHLIWIPPGSKFEKLFSFDNVDVESIDAESALVSKAVKAPAKNKQLIRQAIASDKFKTLADRIVENGGKLEDFL